MANVNKGVRVAATGDVRGISPALLHKSFSDDIGHVQLPIQIVLHQFFILVGEALAGTAERRLTLNNY